MSVRFLNNNASNNTDVVAKTFSSAPPLVPWVRNPSWPNCEADVGTFRMRGLYAVWPSGANFIAMNASTNYEVNFGDGTTTSFGSGVQANYEYNYSSPALVGTEAPVTFTDVGDLVTRANHGYKNGMQVQFFNITTTTGIVNAQFYYVINATANTFQVAATEGGTALPLTNNGTGQLLPYRVATVTITGVNIVLLNLYVKHNQANLQAYSTGWLDIAIALPSLQVLSIGGATTLIRQNYLERVRLNESGAITSFGGLFRNLPSLRNVQIAPTITTVTDTSTMFQNCTSLQIAPQFNTAAVTNMDSMFTDCSSLQIVPLLNTAAVTSMNSMFTSCTNLQTVPLFNTAAATSINSMFTGCASLQTIPLFNTANVTNMAAAFSSCPNLKTIPLFNTANVTNMSNLVSSCPSFETMPLLNTAAVTNMSNMFNGCRGLKTLPLLNTAAVTSMNSMFQNCIGLQTVPLFNTANVTNMSSMFSGCAGLKTVPLFNTVAVTNMTSMFSECSGLSSVPALITSSVTPSANFNTMFSNCPSLARIEASEFRLTFSVNACKLSGTALDEIYTNLPTVVGQTITVLNNYGTATDNPAIATAKGWTVNG
jgi:surface protein